MTQSLTDFVRCREQSRPKRRLRKEVIDAYGGKCSCCGLSGYYEFLSIEHVDEIKPVGAPRSGNPLCEWLKRKKWPDGFRVLCYNCNLSRGFYGYCPHEAANDPDLAAEIEYLWGNPPIPP